MIEYIEYIIQKEQMKLVERLVALYGKKGNFTEVDIHNRFLKTSNIIIVNDNFIKTSGRGRPKKNSNSLLEKTEKTSGKRGRPRKNTNNCSH